LKLRLLSQAILGERIVVNGNERVVTEIRLIVYRHQRVAAERSSFGCALIQNRVGGTSGADTAAFRSAGTTACNRRTGIGLTGSRRWLLLRRALRLGLDLLNLRLLSHAIRGERIVVNGNE
jgi:hypothetical protein